MSFIAYASLWIFVLSIACENVVTTSGVVAITKITGGLAAGLALIAVLISGRMRRWHLFHFAAAVFVIWAGCGVLALQAQSIPKKFWTFVQLFVVLWMIWEIAINQRRVHGLMLAYIMGAYVAALDTIRVYQKEADVLRRFAAGTFDANDLAMELALALPMAWYLGMTFRQPLLRWVCRGYVPIAIFAIGLTGSRGGMLATIVALSIVPLTMTRLSPARLATAIAMLGLAGALAVAYVPETIIHRLATTRTEVEGGRIGGRFKLWAAGIRVFVRKPLIGYGPATFKTAITPELGPLAQVAHNSYVSVLVEEGLVGFVLYGMMIFAVFRAVLALPTVERRFSLILLATLLIAMTPLTWEDRRAVWFILAALIGLAKAQVEGIAETAGLRDQRQAAPPAGLPRVARALGPLTVPGRNPRA